MVTKKELKKATPPYLPYKTFTNFLDRLKTNGIPARIDRSILGSFSGAIQNQLFAALKYLNLMNNDGNPTETLESLVKANEADKLLILKNMLVSSYPFLFREKNELGKITLNQLQERFIEAGASGDTTRKSVKFFLMAAKETGIDLSPYIKKSRIKGPRIGSGQKNKRKEEKQEEGNIGLSSDLQEKAVNPNWQLLLEKFPSFDPEWSDEVKAKWFEGFGRLMDELKK